jgi:hypothetical protein
VKLEVLTPKVVDFLEIRDADTGEVLVRQRGENHTQSEIDVGKLKNFLSKPYDGGSDNHGS